MCSISADCLHALECTFLGSCILTAAMRGLGLVFYVFHDGELSQIVQKQEIPYNRKPCTVLGALDIEGVAAATSAACVALDGNDEIESAIAEARRIAAAGRPVIVDVNIDYSKHTAFMQGAVKTNFHRFPLAQRLRMASRALVRKMTG